MSSPGMNISLLPTLFMGRPLFKGGKKKTKFCYRTILESIKS